MDHTKPRLDLYGVPWATVNFNGMPYRPLGVSGLQASSVGLGAWKIGYPETGDEARVDEPRALKIFDRAIELGVTFWDTANRYNNGSGNSERVIGTWFQQNPDQRRNVVLATKVFGGMDGRTPNHGGLSRGSLLDAVYASLARLQVDHIDLLYFHAYDERTPIEETLTAFEDVVQRDLVRYLAVSNFNVHNLEHYREVSHTLSVRCRPIAVQNQFNILHGEDPQRSGVLDYAARHRLSFVAWSPLGRGLLTERYLEGRHTGPGDRLYDEGTLAQDLVAATTVKLRRLAALAHDWGLKLNELALTYMLALPGMGPVIPSVTSIEQLESNAKAGKLTLSQEQIEKVRVALADLD